MKNLKKIITITFLAFGLTLIAQEDNTRMDKINKIASPALKSCETGPKTIAELDDNLKEKASLYSEYYKQKDYKTAVDFWRPLFFNAPKYSKNLHLRGAKMYKAFAKEAEGEVKESYLDTLYAINEVRITCFGSSAKLLQSKAFDWYSYRSRGNEGFVFELFNDVHKKHIEEGSENDADPTFILYWAKAAIKANKKAKTITDEEVLDIYEITTSIADFNMAAGKDAGKYKGTIDAITEKMKEEEYLVPSKMLELAEKRYRANPNDETAIIKSYKALKACGDDCTSTPLFTEIVTKLAEKRPTAGLYKFLASKALKAGDKDLAISYYQKAIELEDEVSEKENLSYSIAKIYLSKGSLNKAREFARKMLDANPNSGLAYILIGNTYASSGKACSGGVGTGLPAQVVTWAAIDTWQKAKSVDSSVSEEAQRLINKYSQYMPAKADLFYHQLKVGQSYRIECLGVTTTVRSSD